MYLKKIITVYVWINSIVVFMHKQRIYTYLCYGVVLLKLFSLLLLLLRSSEAGKVMSQYWAGVQRGDGECDALVDL